MNADLPTVLIVEDEPSLARAYSKYFEFWGWSPLIAPDADAAIPLLAPGLSLVTLDLMMSGRPAADVLRAVRDSGLAVPVVVLTAMTLDGAIEVTRGLHPDRIFAKQYDFGALQNYIEGLHAGPRRSG